MEKSDVVSTLLLAVIAWQVGGIREDMEKQTEFQHQTAVFAASLLSSEDLLAGLNRLDPLAGEAWKNRHHSDGYEYKPPADGWKQEILNGKEEKK